MLVAISGASGSGKSSVLKKLSNLGFPVVERKTSRSILTDWNVTLEEVNTSTELCIKFQFEMLERKFKDDLATHEKWVKENGPNVIVFTERTFADLFAYMVCVLGSRSSCSDFIDTYHKKCMAYQYIYDRIALIRNGMFAPVVDSVRPTNEHFEKLMGLYLPEVTREMSTQPIIDVSARSIDSRTNIILLNAYANLPNKRDKTTIINQMNHINGDAQ